MLVEIFVTLRHTLYMLKVVNNTTRYKKNVYSCFSQFMGIIRLIVLSFHYVISSTM